MNIGKLVGSFYTIFGAIGILLHLCYGDFGISSVVCVLSVILGLLMLMLERASGQKYDKMEEEREVGSNE